MFGGGGRGEKQLMEQIFSLRFTSKQLNRASRKCEATEKAEKNKVGGPGRLPGGGRVARPGLADPFLAPSALRASPPPSHPAQPRLSPDAGAGFFAGGLGCLG